MSHARTIARPYAKAAYRYAVDKRSGEVEKWGFFLDTAARICADEAVRCHLSERGFFGQLENWIDRYLLTARKSGLTRQEKNFLTLLRAHDRMAVLGEIAREFHHLRHASEGICEALVHTAKPLDNEQIENIRAFLARKTGKKVAIETREASHLLAGIRVEYDGLVIDQSAKGRIAAFARKFEDSRK